MVSFSQDNVTSPTKIVFSVVGLNPNCHHPIKIHEFGDLTNGCATTGNEYNLLKEKSNDKNENSLGVLSADILGNAYVCFKDSNIQLYGENSILGRSVVIHADPRVADKDETSLACGIIGRAKEFKTVPPFSEAK